MRSARLKSSPEGSLIEASNLPAVVKSPFFGFPGCVFWRDDPLFIFLGMPLGTRLKGT